MKKTFCLLALLLLCVATFADNKATVVDSSENVVTAVVCPTSNIARVPIVVSMTNPTVPMTCMQCYIEPPCEDVKFCQVEDGSIIQTSSKRWGAQHQAVFSTKPKNHPNSMMVMVVSTSSSNFAGNEGPIITVYFDASSLSDGDYTIKLKDINMVWTDKRDIVTYLSPDTEVPFSVKNKTIVTK